MGKKPLQGLNPAKERILDAALARFSTQSYESTSLREIAADALVDVAYVHRAFGSKADLFQEVLLCVIAQDESANLFSMPANELPQRLAHLVVSRSITRTPGQMGAFEIAMQSSTSHEARAAVLAFVENDFLKPLTQKLEHEDRSRAVLITALLAGVDLMRSVIGAKSATDLDSAWLQESIAEMIRCAAVMAPPPDHTDDTDNAIPARVCWPSPSR